MLCLRGTPRCVLNILHGNDPYRSLKLWYPPLRGKTALIIVDLQNDFVTGTLPVNEGEQAVLGTNELRKVRTAALHCL